jgi:Golgi apparatus protein 1
MRSKSIVFAFWLHFKSFCLPYLYINIFQVAKMILEAEFDETLDPLFYKACKSSISRHCSNAVLSRGGNFDSVLECLKADFYANQISDPACAQQLVRRTKESLVDIHMDPGLHEACSIDIQRLCQEIPPGQSRGKILDINNRYRPV